jgi:hypothetical protein
MLFCLASRNAKKGVLTTHLQLETVRVSTISVKSQIHNWKGLEKSFPTVY